MKRRAYLATAATALSGAVSGCQSDAGTSPPPEDVRLTELTYVNADRKPHRLHVLLLEDDDPVYWTTKAVDPAERQDDGTLRATAGAFESYPTEPGPYELHARLEDAPRAAWETTEFDAVDAVADDIEYRCFRVVIDIRDDQVNLLLDSEWPDDDTDAC